MFVGVTVAVVGIVLDCVGKFSTVAIGKSHGQRHFLASTNSVHANHGFMRHRKLGPWVSDDFFAQCKRHEPVTTPPCLYIASRPETYTAQGALLHVICVLFMCLNVSTEGNDSVF